MPHIRPFESLSVQGAVVPPRSTVLLKPVKQSKNIRDGFLRVHNVSNRPQVLYPSKIAQAQHADFVPEIQGDKNQASMPMAWNNTNLLFEILSMNNSLLPNGTRTMNNVETFTQPGSKWTMKQIVCAVQPLPGSRPAGPDNPNNYMGYDRTNWQLFDLEVREGLIEDVDGVVTDHALNPSAYAEDDELAYVLNVFGHRWAFLVQKSDGASYEHKKDALGVFLDSIGTGGCISLIQKAIRRRPEFMRHPETNELFGTEEIVQRITRRMCCGRQSGYFLPLIGKFVTPLEHFLKRLFIIAAEDSEYSREKMFFVCTKALLASKLPHWRPSRALVDSFVAESLRLLHSSVTSHYETNFVSAFTSDLVTNLPAMVQSELGGMSGDQKMLRWLASKPSDWNRIGTPNQPLSGVDPLDVYCDQHQDGRLVCFIKDPRTRLPPNVFQKAEEDAFFQVSGYNTRRQARRETYAAEQQMVFDALRASSKTRRGIVPKMPEAAAAVKQWSLPVGALAGMLGTIEITDGTGRYLVTVSAHDLTQFVVIPKPTRDNKKLMSDITPQERDAIIHTAKTRLRRGKIAANVPDKSFGGAKIVLRGDEWFVNGRPWVQEARHIQTTLAKEVDWSKLHEPREDNWSWSQTFGAGQTFCPEVVQWCLGRMKGYNTITIPKINRIGAGTDESLTGLEARGFQYMMHLSEHYPDALWLTKSFTFDTKCMALRQELCMRLASSQHTSCRWPAWSSHLSMRSAQQRAFTEMCAAHEKGLASFLWMLVGQGKTLTVLNFLESTRACKHIVWAAPKSAVDSIAEIVAEVGWKPVLLFPSEGLRRKYVNQAMAKRRENKDHNVWNATTNTNLTTRVTLIEHDHLRKLAGRLAPQMGTTAFIFDEVHKTMQSGTQRTAAALRLARLAKQLVALTGTPIVDKKGYGLLKWLQLCMPFPLTASNFWVGANSMITQLNSGDVNVTDETVDVTLQPDDQKFFKSRFPRRPPWYGETETPTRESWVHMHMKSRQICDAKIVAMAVHMYENHPQDWRADHVQAIRNNSHSQRPLIVAFDQRHAVELIDKLVTRIDPRDILLVGGTRPGRLSANVAHHKSVHLTEQKVLDGKVHPFKVVVAALRNCEGYSLTWMTCQITGSYPSNQASRTQMRGRINRLDAQRKEKKYWTVVAGVTSVTVRYQEEVKMIEDALRAAPSRKKRKR